jgi:hypothetical protein
MKDAVLPLVRLYKIGAVPQRKATLMVLEKLSREKAFQTMIGNLAVVNGDG